MPHSHDISEFARRVAEGDEKNFQTPVLREKNVTSLHNTPYTRRLGFVLLSADFWV
jgi:hypothetical protein